MDLSLLKTFLAVHRSGSLTAAARQVGRSQSTVTAQIRTLEEQLGQQLFLRMPRGVVPTSVADELAAEAGPHVDALATIAERGVAGRTTPFTKPMHLAGPAELMSTRVLAALAPLVHDGLRLRVTLGLTDELLAGLPDGRFDLVISTHRPRGKAIASVPLTDEEFVLVAAPHLAALVDGGQLIREGPVALRELPLISYAEDRPIIRRYWRTVFGTRPTSSPAVVVPRSAGCADRHCRRFRDHGAAALSVREGTRFRCPGAAPGARDPAHQHALPRLSRRHRERTVDRRRSHPAAHAGALVVTSGARSPDMSAACRDAEAGLHGW